MKQVAYSTIAMITIALLYQGCNQTAGNDDDDYDDYSDSDILDDTSPKATTGDSIDTGNEFPYLIGAGIHDTTGPPAEVMFAGYCNFDQKGKGIHMRTRSRAFVIGDGEHRVALVSVGISLLSSGVHYYVIKKLKETFGDLYTEKNVVLSATHTHSAPGAHFKTYLLNTFAGMGFSKANFDAQVNGIYESIVKAHNNMGPAKIVYNSGEFPYEKGKRLNRNRSPDAYYLNYDIDKYMRPDGSYEDTNRSLEQLKFIREDGTEIGVYHWLPHHPNISGSHLFLINGDVNGLAAYRFEKSKDADYLKDDPFVAAFAYTNASDNSGNLPEDVEYFKKEYPEENLQLDERGNWIADGSHDYERMELRTDTVMALAEKLYAEEGEEITGPVDSRQMFVYVPNFPIKPEFIDDRDIYYEDLLGESKDTCQLCSGAAGVSFIAGSMEDGDSGMVSAEANPRTDLTDYTPYDVSSLFNNFVPWVTSILLNLSTSHAITKPEMDCQKEKTIAISLHEAKQLVPGGKTWNLNQPIQIIRIGPIGILALPLEVSLMSGRRLKSELLKAMPDVSHAMINSTSNATAMYLTTRQEYASQQYEGGANLMGPYTLNGIRQMVHDLAGAFGPNAKLPDYAVSIDAVADSLQQSATMKTGEVIYDGKFIKQKWGEVKEDVLESYPISDDALRPTIVRVSFVGAHPNNNLQHQKSYLEVLRIDETEQGIVETPIARDWDPETRFIWERDGVDRSTITIEWHIPLDTPRGTYQIVYHGHNKKLIDGSINPFSGRSRLFQVN